MAANFWTPDSVLGFWYHLNLYGVPFVSKFFFFHLYFLNAVFTRPRKTFTKYPKRYLLNMGLLVSSKYLIQIADCTR